MVHLCHFPQNKRICAGFKNLVAMKRTTAGNAPHGIQVNPGRRRHHRRRLRGQPDEDGKRTDLAVSHSRMELQPMANSAGLAHLAFIKR